MSVLNAAKEKRLKPSQFGLPEKKGPRGGVQGKYPMPNKPHARDALARASEELAKGNLTPEQAAEIKHKAHVVLGETDSTYHGAKK
jgi:hypothetical protein